MFLLGSMAVIGGYLYYSYLPPKDETSGENKKNETGVLFPSTPQSSNRIKDHMTLIAGGSFKMGRDDADLKNSFTSVQYPAINATVPSFFIDKTEVTNEEYALFVQDAKHSPPEHWQNGKPITGQERFPVTYVSYNDAKEFAEWVTKREGKLCQLPDEKEWEFAARSGNQGNIFPWGNEWIPGRSNLDSGQVKEVGSFEDVTPAGVQDMLGNVMEWTSTKWNVYPKHPNYPKSREAADVLTVRGEKFNSLPEEDKNKEFLLTSRTGVRVNDKGALVGFRLICYP